MTIEQAKQVLRDNGYFVDNLWNVSDVQEVFQTDDTELCQKILLDSMTNECTMEQINFSIDTFGEMYNLKHKD